MYIIKIVQSIILELCILLTSLFSPEAVLNQKDNDLSLYSLSCVLIDGDTGRLLYGKNENDIRAMASTTKVMTLILALENGDLNSEIEISSYAASMPEVKLGMRAGEKYKLKDLLYSLILESHNDTAVAIAEGIAGSTEAFAEMMNEKAAELGLNSTYFITPNGLDAEDENGSHSTTALDLARLTKYAVFDSEKSELFNEISATRSYSFTELTNGRGFTVSNKNSFLDMMDGVIAGKTGFTADAGYCYTAALSINGKNFVIALLGCGWPSNKTYKWKDARLLFEYGLNNYEIKVLDLSDYIGQADIKNGVNSDSESLQLTSNETIYLLLADTDKLEVRLAYPETIEAPVDSSLSCGELKLYINDELIEAYPLYIEKSVARYDYDYCVNYLFNYIFAQ